MPRAEICALEILFEIWSGLSTSTIIIDASYTLRGFYMEDQNKFLRGKIGTVWCIIYSLLDTECFRPRVVKVKSHITATQIFYRKAPGGKFF